MALANYTDLKTSIETWLARSGDATITGNAADLVTMAEARINRDLIALRINQVDNTSLTGSVGSRNLTLPSDYLAPISLWLTTNGTDDYLRPIVIGSMPLGTSNGTPQAWGIDGTNIALDVPCDQAHTFKFRYYARLDIAADTTNWLLTNYPDVYVYATLFEAAVLTGDVEAAQGYEAIYQQRVRGVRAVEALNARVAPLTVDPALVTAGGYNINTDGYN